MITFAKHENRENLILRNSRNTGAFLRVSCFAKILKRVSSKTLVTAMFPSVTAGRVIVYKNRSVQERGDPRIIILPLRNRPRDSSPVQ
jgi:hypothetical protein